MLKILKCFLPNLLKILKCLDRWQIRIYLVTVNEMCLLYRVT